MFIDSLSTIVKNWNFKTFLL